MAIKGRPKKVKEGEIESTSKPQSETMYFSRMENGLVEGVTYKFLPNGLIDWEGMINPKFVILFADKASEIEKKYGESVKTLQKKVQDGDVDVESKYKLVLLQGWRELATLRGYSSYTFTPLSSSPNFISVFCNIKWLPNFETSGVPAESSDGADAHPDNTYDFAANYLTSIACNRAFCRAVRGFLNISILASDEISDKKAKREVQTDFSGQPPSPQDSLKKVLALNFSVKDFDGFKSLLKSEIRKGNQIISNDDFSKWSSYSDFNDIPKRECVRLIGELKKIS